MVNIGGCFHTRSMFFFFFFDMWQLVCSIFQNTSENWADLDGLLVRNEETISYILYRKRLCTILHGIQLKNSRLYAVFFFKSVWKISIPWNGYDQLQSTTLLIKNSLKVEFEHLQKLGNRWCQGWMGYLTGSYTGLSSKKNVGRFPESF